MQTLTPRPRGFIAIISAIVISAILIVVAVTSSVTELTIRYDILSSEYKERSYGLANACAQWMLLRMYYDVNYPTGYTMPDTVAVGSDSCSVVSCTGTGSSARVCNIEAQYEHAYTNVVVTVTDPTRPSVSSWTEVARF